MGANERRKGRKGGGRRARIEARSSSAAAATPGVDRKVPCFELLPEETLELIEHNADTLLEEIGVEFREVPEALELFAAAGADVDGERVRFAAETVPKPGDRHGTGRIHPARAQSGTIRHHWRRSHRFCAGLRIAVRA